MRIHRVVTGLVAVGLLAGACGATPAATSPSPSSASSSAAAATSAAPKAPVKIGALIPLTGPSAATGQDMKDGYELALEQINTAGGVNGAKVEMIYEDDKNDPATAVASWEKLVNNDKVEIMVGGLSSTISLALVESAKKAQVPMAWTGAAASAFETAMKDQAYFFHYHPWDYMNGASNIAFLKSTPYKKYAIAYEDGAFGTASFAGLQTSLPDAGMTIVGSEKFKTGSTDFTAMLNKLKSTGAEGFIVVPYAADVTPMLTQMKEVGWAPKLIFGAPPSWPADFAKSPVAEGVAAAALWTPDVATDASKKFLADFQKKYNKAPASYWAPLAYTNLVTAIDALRKSGVGNKAGWITAMEATSYASPIGPTLKFTKSNVINHQGFTQLLAYQYQGGKVVIVFPSDLATGKLK